MFAASKVAGAVSAAVNYIEDVFSTYLYTGTDAARTITNNIDLSTKGGLVWTKDRSVSRNHFLIDTVRGVNNNLNTDNTNAQATSPTVTAFNTDGFSLSNQSTVNSAPDNYVSWTFRKQPKFFDVVTYTGNSSTQNIAHSLGSVPGCIIIKCITNPPAVGSTDWTVYHRSLGNTQFVALNTTNAASTNTRYWDSTTPTSTYFTLGNETDTNATGGTYVAYIFAHNAGGFGLTGTDNVISCGSFTVDGSGNATVSLGYEPQYILYKKYNTTGQWYIEDTMRGLPAAPGIGATLIANLANAESNGNGNLNINATGFTVINGQNLGASDQVIYIAIRRGPMKVPTDATKVFAPVSITGNNSTSRSIAMGINPDLFMFKRTSSSDPTAWTDKLRGNTKQLNSTSAAAEVTQSLVALNGFENTGVNIGARTDNTNLNYSPFTYALYGVTRAPNFFDEVCYTGNGAGTYLINHNLTVVPEMLIIKDRSVGDRWSVYFPSFDTFMTLNAVNGKQNGSPLPSAVTSTTFNVGNTTGYASVSGRENTSGATYVSYLFATCPGVSKVGSYTGTGATQTISCGFTGGARWVLIKRTDSTGDWYVWDTARGMVAGTDPSLMLNSTAAEVNANSVYTTTGGFQIVSTAAGINANGGSYIYLAIA